MKLYAFLVALLNRWVIAGTLVLGGLLFGLTVIVLMFGRPEPQPAGPATAVLVVISAPTSTPVPKTPTISPTELTPPPEEGKPGEGLAVGKIVRVNGTGGEGLRVREQSGLDELILFLASDGETYEIRDGPREQDSYEWWLLVSTENQERRGWAVSNFLSVVSGL